MTYGEKVIRTDLNASNNSEVQTIKNLFASHIDKIWKSLEDVDQFDEKYNIKLKLTEKVTDKLEDVAMYYIKLLTA